MLENKTLILYFSYTHCDVITDFLKYQNCNSFMNCFSKFLYCVFLLLNVPLVSPLSY